MKYATQMAENRARAMGVSLPISYKHSVEVCRELRGRPLDKALRLLDRVVLGRQAIAFKRYNSGGVGHRPAMGPGRFPVKACGHLRLLLMNAQANASQKGLNVGRLFVRAAVPKKSGIVMHYGRRRREMKRTHVEIVLEEGGISEPSEAQPLKAQKSGEK